MIPFIKSMYSLPDLRIFLNYTSKKSTTLYYETILNILHICSRYCGCFDYDNINVINPPCSLIIQAYTSSINAF